MAERLTLDPTLEPLSTERLQAFTELCLRAGDDDRTDIGVVVNHCAGYVDRSPFGGQTSSWPQETAERLIEHQPQVRRLIGAIYDTDNPAELTGLLATDLAAWRALSKMLIELSPHHPTDISGPYRFSRELAFQLVGPQLANGTNDQPQAYPTRHLPFGFFKPSEQPCLTQRLQEGMPREAQLLGLAMLIPGQFGLTEEGMTYDSFRFLGLCWELNVSTAELRTAYGMLTGVNPKKAGDILTVVLNDATLSEFFRREDGRFDLELFGGNETFVATVRSTFLQLVEDNGGSALARWQTIEQNFAGEMIEAAAPRSKRSAVVHKMVIERSVNFRLIPLELHADLQSYIDEPQLAAEYEQRLTRLLEAPGDLRFSHHERPLSYHAAKLGSELNVDLHPDQLRYSEEPYASIIRKITTLTAPDDALHVRAALLAERAEGYDPGLKTLLTEFAAIANDACFEYLGQGYSYDDDPEWFDAREARQKELKPELERLKLAIQSFVTRNTSPDND